MSHGIEDATNRELSVDLAIYDYHSAVDRGEAPSPEEWIARHPGIADDLVVYFQDLAAFFGTGVGVDGSTEESTRTYPSVLPGAEPAELDRPRAGDALGGYALLERLGGGGQGEVWKARHFKSNDVVALKVLHPWAEQDEDSIRRLTDEARIIAALKHPNIIGIKYFDHDRGRWFIAMDLMEGGTVARRYKEKPATPRQAAMLMEKVARAIHHAHTRNPGVLHLDLKPGNILLDADGEPRVTDFGLAMRVESLAKPALAPATAPADEPDPQLEPIPEREEASRTLTRLGAVGTYPYMSPEMAGGRWNEVSTASDIYGLGAILYAMLTGKPPFQGPTDGETLALVVEGNLVPPRRYNRDVDPELQAVCLRCLHRDPALRHGSADALANDLRRWLRGEPTLAGRPSVDKHIRFWLRRHPVLFTLTLLAFAILGIVAGSFGQVRASNAREAERLAREIDDKLRMIGRAIARTARDENLLTAFRRHGGQPRELNKALDAFLVKTTKDYNYWFDLTDSNPLYNVYLLDPAGILLADTIPSGPSFLGKDFSRRDYFQSLFRAPLADDPGAVYVSRVYHSIKDNRYKFAIATRVWDQGRCLAVLVANVTVGWRLVDLDMHHELAGAVVVSPLDWSYTGQEDAPPSRYVVALSPAYADSDGVFEPLWRPSSRLPAMARFSRDPGLADDVEYVRDGGMTNYHRVGKTPLVVVLRHPYPWPLNLMATRWAFPALLIACLASAFLILLRGSRRMIALPW